ncbi:hypothetical protein HRbin04_01303 [archaeon HR04]|nr:hypothetical protein HRbin04_01303 [archaeon HR04]
MMLAIEILNRYRDYVMLNKNIFIAGVCAFIASALIAEAYYTMDRSAAINSTMSVAVEYGIYIPLFAYLYYKDNKGRYRDEYSNIVWSRVLMDARKLIATLSSAEMVYAVVRGYMHYHSLTMGMQPYQAAVLSSIVASVLFYTVVNIGARVSRLFN